VPSAPHSTQTGDWLNLLLDEREWDGERLANSVT
jgi:hypothetical protein